jgi:hypothetical protein
VEAEQPYLHIRVENSGAESRVCSSHLFPCAGVNREQKSTLESYSGLISLSESLMLFPNTRTSVLDIFRIPTKATFLSP